MDKNQKVIKKVLAAALSFSVLGAAVAEKGIVGSAIWPFTKNYTQNEIDSAYENAFKLIEDGINSAKGLDDIDEAQGFIKDFQQIKVNLEDDDKKTYGKATKTQKEIKKLLNEINTSINLQEIERRKEEERKKEEENRKEEEHRRKLEEQRLQMEKEERERQEAIDNAIAFLEEKMDSILRDTSKKIENSENMDHINLRAEEIKEKIRQIDNLNRVQGVEALIEEFQAEIIAVLEEEEKVRQANLEKSLKEAKEGLFEAKENLQNLLSELDEENENYTDFENVVIGYHTDLINSIDNMEGAAAVKNDIEEATERLKVLLEQQRQKEEERRVQEELDQKIENLRDPNKQAELLTEGKISLDDVIGGNQKAKHKAAALLKAYERYSKGGKVVPSKGLLLYGPPGTGKTSFVKAFAAEKNLELFVITPSFVMGDDGERKVLEMFVQAKKAAQISGKPVIFLVDEIDAVAQKRSSTGSDKVLVMLMNEIDKLMPGDNVIILATTNRREALDPAIIRSGRLDQSVEVGNPNAEDKKKILDIYLRHFELAGDINVDFVVDKMRGFSGADVKRVVDIAIETAMERQGIETFCGLTITNADLQNAIAMIMDEKTSVY